jgi:GRASP55/65 PDZ-like domain
MSSLFSRPSTISGHRVLLVLDGSPGHEAGLVPFLDIVTSVEGAPLDDNLNTLGLLLVKRIDMPTELVVYNLKTKQTRKTTITPNRRWGGPGCLGIVARFDSFDSKRPNLFHVTQVAKGGPADVAGVVEGSDCILGSDNFNLKTASDIRLLLAAGRKVPPPAQTPPTGGAEPVKKAEEAKGEENNPFGPSPSASPSASARASVVRPPARSLSVTRAFQPIRPTATITATPLQPPILFLLPGLPRQVVVVVLPLSLLWLLV